MKDVRLGCVGHRRSGGIKIQEAKYKKHFQSDAGSYHRGVFLCAECANGFALPS